MANKKSSERPKMDRADRAKQFMPFDALKGLREALAEKERELLLVERKELSEEARAELDARLSQLHEKDRITVNYYKYGEYLEVTGIVESVNYLRRRLMVGDEVIPFDDIYELF